MGAHTQSYHPGQAVGTCGPRRWVSRLVFALQFALPLLPNRFLFFFFEACLVSGCNLVALGNQLCQSGKRFHPHFRLTHPK